MAVTTPTYKEFEILTILWEKGPSSVRDVHEIMSRDNAVGYTTTLKLMQMMLDKGLVRRDASRKVHIYEPAVKEATTQQQALNTMINKVFSGSTQRMVMRALSTDSVSQEELQEIRAMINAFTEKKS